MEQRQQAHLLLDELSDEKLSAVHGLLEAMVEPLSRSLAVAPVPLGKPTHDQGRVMGGAPGTRLSPWHQYLW